MKKISVIWVMLGFAVCGQVFSSCNEKIAKKNTQQETTEAIVVEDENEVPKIADTIDEFIERIKGKVDLSEDQISQFKNIVSADNYQNVLSKTTRKEKNTYLRSVLRNEILTPTQISNFKGKTE